jgi:hypothetical protein
VGSLKTDAHAQVQPGFKVPRLGYGVGVQGLLQEFEPCYDPVAQQGAIATSTASAATAAEQRLREQLMREKERERADRLSHGPHATKTGPRWKGWAWN